MESDVGNVIIPVDAHLLTLTISTPEIVEHPVRVGRETHMQRERIQRTREIKTIRSADSLISSFKEVNKIFGAADIEFRLRNTTSDPVEAPKGSEALDDEGFRMLAKDFPMKNAVSLLLVRRFVGSEGARLQKGAQRLRGRRRRQRHVARARVRAPALARSPR